MSSPINLNDLPAAQLQEVLGQMEEEISVLTSSFVKLRQANNKFVDSISIVKSLSSAQDSVPILIPMTNSLYVPGVLTAKDSVLVDVGTGYYAELDCQVALELYSRRSGFLKANLEKLQTTIETRQNQKSSVIQTLRDKMADIKTQSEAVKAQ